ncbi:UNVERIFIED_CONTAM: hypothetical protein K2H54_063848 [Gekko kuhli]
MYSGAKEAKLSALTSTEILGNGLKPNASLNLAWAKHHARLYRNLVFFYFLVVVFLKEYFPPLLLNVTSTLISLKFFLMTILSLGIFTPYAMSQLGTVHNVNLLSR